jgi:hypothetical protein
MIARVCLAVVAVLAAAWLGLSLRNHQLAQEGLRKSIYAVVPPPGPSRDRLLRHAVQQLHDAQFLNPDKTPALYEGLLQSVQNHEAGVRKLAELARAYPDDALAWAVLLQAVAPSDPRAAQAQAHLRTLIPQRPR